MPVSASHLICWRCTASARRNRRTSETAHATNSGSITKNSPPSTSTTSGGSPNGRSRSCSGGRKGSSANAPYSWTEATDTTISGGTQRHRREGSRPSGKNRSSRPNVPRIHHAFSAVTATSQAH